MTTVTCAIIEKEGKILLARRAQDQKLEGKWEFPGGKVEDVTWQPVGSDLTFSGIQRSRMLHPRI